jgi:uncharacterized protein (UPF0305 family)
MAPSSAFLNSKYLPRRYSRIEVEAMMKFIAEVVEPLVERI